MSDGDGMRSSADAASRFLPHGGTARLIREVLSSSSESMTCIARFPSENALLQDGRAASHLLVEPAAQAAATHLAILAVESGTEIRGFEGFLTSAKNVEFFLPDFPADTDVTIHVRPRGTIRKAKSGLFKFRFEAELDGTPLARGELSTYVMPLES
jgi:predicted hotdog family 3-hydroxylacyl-ACP dehydratase